MRLVFVKIIVLIFGFLSLITSCVKDHPNDIPDFIKKEIEECKKSNDCCGYYIGCLTIDEVKRLSDNTTLFCIYYELGNHYRFFDIEGNYLFSYNSPTGIKYPPDGYEVIRKIWTKNDFISDYI